MKELYQKMILVMIVSLITIFPFVAMAQEKPKDAMVSTNTAKCYNYWSIGAFGGITQFNGDLSRNSWVNLTPNNIGYNVGFAVTKQFSRVIGVRARFAYAHLHNKVEGKWVWDYQDGNGLPQRVSQSFRTSLFESDLQVTLNWLNWILSYKPERIFSSYVFAGAGVDHSSGIKLDGNGKEIAYLGKGSDVLNVGNTKGLGGDNLAFKVSAGLGFDFNLSKHFSVPIEFAWRWQNSDLLDMTRGGAKAMENDMYSSATVGLTYKFGYSCPKVIPEVAVVLPVAVAIVAPEPTVRFYVNAPKNIPTERMIREIFPLRNYVFFDLGSTEIPGRYVLLTKDLVKDFKEDDLEMYPPKNLAGRSQRQMIVYYNVLNILGDRMGRNPSTTISLSGSSREGKEDGMAMAESVKRYLVNIFGIDPSRITTEGRIKPKIPSEKPGGTKELDLLREGDRRVSVWSTSPTLLMEFQSGPDAPLKSVMIYALQKEPIDSYVSFNALGSKAAYSSWSLEIKDENGTVQNFGPYTKELMRMPGKNILGNRPEGTYNVTMVGQTKSGMIVRKDTSINMVLWTPAKTEELTRFSIIFEFDESKATLIYEKYLTDIVVPKIPLGATVMIHGYTDIIGDEDHNLNLSLERANEVRNILAEGLSKAGRSDVKFEVYGLGADPNLSPFENKYPEERFYNRTVIIDIVPQK